MSFYNIGIDIGSKKIKMVRVKKKGTCIKIINFSSRETPAGSIERGNIKNSSLLGNVIAELTEELGLKNKAVVTAIAGPQVYTRIISMPRLKWNELRKAVTYEATAFLPIPTEEAAMDIFPIREYQDNEGAKVELFFAAVRRRQVEKIEETCKLGGVKLRAIEIEPLALNRLFQDVRSTEITAFLNVGASRSCFSVHKEGILIYNRYFSSIYMEYQSRIEMSYGQSLLQISKNKSTDNRIEVLTSELIRSIGYFRMQHKHEIGKIIITGGGARMQGLKRAMEAAVDCEVEVGDAVCKLDIADKFGEDELDEIRYDFAVAIGLAIRGA